MNLPLSNIANIKPASHWLSGEAAFIGLKDAVDKLVRLAPKDCDVLIRAFDITVIEVTYIEPYTLLFRGLDDHRNDTFVVAHYSQLVAHVIYLPKQTQERVITGFLTKTEKEL